MERTESVVIQVAPAYENQKIEEMQTFGWSLHGRQEIHQEGDAYGRPSYTSDSTYIIKTTVKHYVKLHFIRSLSLPNLERLRRIQNEYDSLPFPAGPSLLAPGCWTVLFGIATVGVIPMMLSAPEGKGRNMLATGIMLLLVYGALASVSARWFMGRRAKRREADAYAQRSLARARELLAEARQLSSVA